MVMIITSSPPLYPSSSIHTPPPHHLPGLLPLVLPSNRHPRPLSPPALNPALPPRLFGGFTRTRPQKGWGGKKMAALVCGFMVSVDTCYYISKTETHYNYSYSMILLNIQNRSLSFCHLQLPFQSLSQL